MNQIENELTVLAITFEFVERIKNEVEVDSISFDMRCKIKDMVEEAVKVGNEIIDKYEQDVKKVMEKIKNE